MFECHGAKEICLFLQTIQTGFGAHSDSHLMGIGGFFPSVKRPGREVDRSRVSGARTSVPLYTFTARVGTSLLYVLLCRRERRTIAYLFKSVLQNGIIKENTKLKFGTLKQRFQSCSTSTKVNCESEICELQVSCD